MTGQELYRQAKQLIPGGTQLLSKRPEMFLPDHWPSYYAASRGVEILDLEGRCFVDMSLMGVGACVLGYRDADVDEAVKDSIDGGAMCTLNAPEEVALAVLLTELHPWADMVRYARAGGEAASMAVRIARAHTRRDKIAFCGYHGWGDWYLAANLGEEDALAGQLMPGLEPAGVPLGLKGTAFPFHYNQIDQLKAIVDRHGRDLAAIVMEPQRGDSPCPGFLEEVRQIATDTRAVLIFDEITTGFRMTSGGIHLLLNVTPDMAVFAKAMANGYAMAAVIGKAGVMHAAESTFISSTNWSERLGPTASLATIRKHLARKVSDHLIRIGNRVLAGWRDAAGKAGLKMRAGGLPSLAHFNLLYDNETALITLFTQLMLDRGFLAFNQFKPSFAHQDCHVDQYLSAVRESFIVLGEALEGNDVEKRLRGGIAERGFYRLNK